MNWIKMTFARRRQHESEDKQVPKKRRLLFRSPTTISTCCSSVGLVPADDASWKIENVLVKGPPSEAEWWGEESSSPEEVSCSTEKDSSSDESSRRFQNCGYHAWKQARSEWRRETVEKRPSRPPPVRRDQVARGLRQSARQYELPGRMKLKDVVTIYAADIWDLDPEDMW